MSLKLHQSVKLQPAIRPQAAAAGTVNGLSIDRLGFEDAVLLVSAGAVAGAPTAQTVDVKIQDSADGTTWVDVAGLAVEQITAGDTSKELGINLSPRAPLHPGGGHCSIHWGSLRPTYSWL